MTERELIDQYKERHEIPTDTPDSDVKKTLGYSAFALGDAFNELTKALSNEEVQKVIDIINKSTKWKGWER